MYKFFLIALGVGMVMTSQIQNKFSNKTYCEKKNHIFGDDKNDATFTGVLQLPIKTSLRMSRWTNLKKRYIQCIKMFFNNIDGPVKNFDDEYARLTFTLFS